MFVEIREKPFNGWEEIAAYASCLQIGGQYGASASFIGSMRTFNEDQKVTSLFLEHYPEMTKKHLTALANDVIEKWQLLDVLILHRIGQIEIEDHIVLVATWSAHRKAAFESCRNLMETLKSTAPFWKKEETATGSKWVEKNTEGF